MTRREAAESVFQYIRNNNFIPTNIQYLDGYFVFNMGEDSVVHFDIKGLYGWKFSMWIETNPEKLKDDDGKEYPAIQFFCQHHLNIDKFKPSTSYFLEKYNLRDIENPNKYQYSFIINIMRMIKRHPFVAFSMDYNMDSYWEKSYIGCYLGMKFYKSKKVFKERIEDTWTSLWHGSKVKFINRYKVVNKVVFIDNNNDDWKCSPRYEMTIHFNKISDKEEEQEAAELRVINHWLRKGSYKNMNVHFSREGLNGTYTYSWN